MSTKLTQEEEVQRALRVWEFLENSDCPVLIKDVRKSLGLSYAQARRALSNLEKSGIINITVTADWNGCYYIYPHRIWLTENPRTVIRG